MLECPLPLAGGAQSSLPPCPADTRVHWHKCHGTFTGTNGERYVGEWQDDKFHGQGVYTFTSGERYVGGYRDGKRDGLGVWTNSSGHRYGGEYRDGKKTVAEPTIGMMVISTSVTSAITSAMVKASSTAPTGPSNSPEVGQVETWPSRLP